MINLEKAIVQNFLGYGDETTIPLNAKGFVLILGIDGDPGSSNGAGKSSMASAISYAFFGKTINKQKADEVINRFRGKNCFVHLFFSIGEDKYEIRRSRGTTGVEKPNDLTFSKNGKSISKSTNEETQKVIEQITGLTFEVFQAMMPGSSNLASMNDSELKDLLEGVLGMHKYSEAFEKVSAEVKDLRKELARAGADSSSFLARKEQLTASLQEMIDSEQERKNSHNTRVAEAKKSLKDAKDTCEEVLFSKPLKPEKPSDSNTGLQEARMALDAASKTLATFDHKAAKLVAGVDAEVNLLSKQITSIQSLDTCPTCLGAMEHKSTCLASLEEQLRDKKKLLESTKKKISKLREKDSKAYEECLGKVRSFEEAEKGIALERAKYSSDLQVYTSWEQKMALAKASVESCKKLLASVEASKVADSSAGISVIENEISKLSKELEESSKVESSIEDRLKIAEFWMNAYSPKGIRAKILENILPFMNKRSNHYSQILNNGETKVRFSTITQRWIISM
jgi:DNA repair exonuclease SbcCD ATPase subunit